MNSGNSHDPGTPRRLSKSFRIFAHRSSQVAGSPWAFIVAVIIILVWLATGPVFNFSNTWQLIINTGTTILTFLMVFLIQNTQNRDAIAMHLKLDELIRSIKEARNRLVDLEDLSDEELARLQQEFERLRKTEETMIAERSRSPKATPGKTR